MKPNPIVLFVDDDHSLLNGLKRVLHHEPYTVLTATDAVQGLKMLQSHAVSVIVSDEKMPLMGGTEFLAIAAKEYPQTVRIMLTGKADLDTAVKAINKGQIYRFLTKPCSGIELGVCIRQALQHRELLLQAQRLLETLKMQSSYIEHLEKEYPGISQVKRDVKGRITLEPEPCDIDSLLKEIEEELDRSSR